MSRRNSNPNFPAGSSNNDVIAKSSLKQNSNVQTNKDSSNNTQEDKSNDLEESRNQTQTLEDSNITDNNDERIQRSHSNNVSINSARESNNAIKRNFLKHLFYNFRTISKGSQIILIINLISSFIPLFGTPVILVLTRHSDCDKPLQYFLIVHLLCWAFNIPACIAHYLMPYTYNNSNNNNNNNNNHINLNMLIWIEKIKSVNDLLLLLVFVSGNYLLFTTTFCASSSKLLFYYTLSLIVYNYMLIVIPVIICGAIIFCLPCLILTLRTLNGDKLNNLGASKQTIDSIELFRYKKPQIHSIPNSPTFSKSDKSRRYNSTHVFYKLKNIFRKKSINEKSKKLRKVHAPRISFDMDNSTCTICLENYKDNDLLRKIKCGHHFHQWCLDSWLKLNKTCPLCKKDVENKQNEQKETV